MREIFEDILDCIDKMFFPVLIVIGVIAIALLLLGVFAHDCGISTAKKEAKVNGYAVDIDQYTRHGNITFVWRKELETIVKLNPIEEKEQ